MAAGSGDSRLEFHGDAGEIFQRDLAAALPRTSPSSLQGTPTAPGKIRRTNAPGGTNQSSVAKKDFMVKLKASVLDALSLLQSMVEDGNNRMASLHRRIGEGHGSCLVELGALDDQFVWLDEVGFDVPRLIKEARLALDTQWLQAFGLPIRTPEDHVISERFETLSSRLLSSKEAVDMVNDLRREVTKLLFPLGDYNLPEMLVALNKFTMTDMVGNTRAALAESKAELDALNSAIEMANARLLTAVQEERMNDADTTENELLGLLDARVQLFAKRIRMLTSADDGDGALAQLDSILKNPAVRTLLDEKQALLSTIRTDMSKLEEDRLEKLRDNENCLLRYSHNCQKSVARIKENHSKQHAKWCELEKILEELIALDREGESLTRSHIQMTEIEQKRRQEHREFRSSNALHRQTLEDLQHNTEAAIAFADELLASVNAGKEKLITNRVEETLKEILLLERKQYLSAFASYGEKNQTIGVRSERKVAAMERMLNDLQFVRKQCHDTFDDGSQSYAKRINDMERQVRKFRKQMDALEEGFTTHETTYLTLEQVMVDALGHLVVTGSEAAPDADDSSTADPSRVEPLTLHLRLKRSKANQFRRFVENASALTASNLSTVEHSKQRVEQISMEASSLKETLSSTRLHLSQSTAVADASTTAAADGTLNVSAIDVSTSS